MDDQLRAKMVDDFIKLGLESTFGRDTEFWQQLAEACLEMSTWPHETFSEDSIANLPGVSFVTDHATEGKIAVGDDGLYIVYYNRPFKKLPATLVELEHGLAEGGVFPEFTMKCLEADDRNDTPRVQIDLRDKTHSSLLGRMIVRQDTFAATIKRAGT